MLTDHSTKYILIPFTLKSTIKLIRSMGRTRIWFMHSWSVSIFDAITNIYLNILYFLYILKKERSMVTSLVMINNSSGRYTNFDLSQAQQISSEQSQMCDPNNPKLNFVNPTESEICGIPKSVKNQTTLDNSSSTTPRQ